MTLGDNWEDELKSLGPDWDSYHGAPIAPDAINTLKSFAVVPCFDGGVQLEVHRDGVDFELNIGRQGTIEGIYLGPASKPQIAPTDAPQEKRCSFCGDLDEDCSCDRKPRPSNGVGSFLVHAAVALFGCCVFCLIFYAEYKYDLSANGGALMASIHAKEVYSITAAIMCGGMTGSMMTKWWKDRR